MSDSNSIAADRSQAAPLPTWLQAVLIPLVVLLIYIPAMRAEFVWDDDLHLHRNIVFAENGLYRAWFTTDYVNYWPITSTSFWLEARLWDFEPTGFHVDNVLVHALSSLLIWRVLLRLKVPAAWLAAMVFAIHPVNVESVAWVTQRKNVLCLLFYSASLLCFLRFDAGRAVRWYWLAFAAFAASMLSKSAGATLPIVLLLFAWWQRGTITRRDVIRSLPFFAVTALMSAVEIWVQTNRSIAGEVIRDAGFFERLAVSGWIAWFYFYKAVLPINLAFVYPLWEIDPWNWLSYVPGVSLVILLVACWRFRSTWGRAGLFALVYFAVTLGPVLGFVDFFYMKYSLVGDHYQYLSIIGIIALVIGSAATATGRMAGNRRQQLRYSGALVVVVLGYTTWQQAGVYKDELTLWLDTLEKNPKSWMAHDNCGIVRSNRGEHQKAVQRFQTADKLVQSLLHLERDKAMVRFNLANELRLLGQFPAAISYYEKVIELDPQLLSAHNNLRKLRWDSENIGTAILSCKQKVRIQPQNAVAHENLAALLRYAGRLNEADRHLRTARELRREQAATRGGMFSNHRVPGEWDRRRSRNR